MILKVFIDSDVILDVASGREPFVRESADILNKVENGSAFGLTSPNTITNIFYILSKISSSAKAVEFIKKLLRLVDIGIVDHDTILKASESAFSDFEDAVQNYCAVKNQCDYIITRNVRDYKNSELKVLEPMEFNALFHR